MNMSPEATSFMRRLASEYVSQNYPNHRLWNVELKIDDVIRNELRSKGLIKLSDAPGSACVLTDAGQQWVMQNRAY
jgi:hypothetical protein